MEAFKWNTMYHTSTNFLKRNIQVRRYKDVGVIGHLKVGCPLFYMVEAQLRVCFHFLPGHDINYIPQAPVQVGVAVALSSGHLTRRQRRCSSLPGLTHRKRPLVSHILFCLQLRGLQVSEEEGRSSWRALWGRVPASPQCMGIWARMKMF